MRVIHCNNVNEGLREALIQLLADNVQRPSRNGPVMAFPEPVTTVYHQPANRVLISQVRNANPTFHLLESLWMLAGRSDVRFPAEFVKNIKNFSDDGQLFHGAYGHRWRHWFGGDQIQNIITELMINPSSRRAVLQMWDGKVDPAKASANGKDVPCNTSIYFDLRAGSLNMTVCCRSNDIIWGCYGANAVHMSILQEYVASAVGVPMGRYYQMSNDLHLYMNLPLAQNLEGLIQSLEYGNRGVYSADIKPRPLIAEYETAGEFMEDIRAFFNRYDSMGLNSAAYSGYRTKFMRVVVAPMLMSWLSRANHEEALNTAYKIEALDWRMAMIQWLDVRKGGAA